MAPPRSTPLAGSAIPEPMPTVRLYFEDPDLLAFESAVIALGEHQGRKSIVLERSAFFPEGGGQLGDHGTLEVGGVRAVVEDVQVDDAGVVHHLVSAADAFAPGASVRGEIDRARRRIHRALHTGQHVLSAAFVEVASAATVSARLGETTSTIDLGGFAPDERAVARAEALANAVVDDDVPIRAWFPEPGELETLQMRRKPKVERDVRVVAIGDFDLSPCGGTHCGRSAQVGLVAVTGIERYKGGTRITFSAGSRARAELANDAGILRSLSREMSCGPADVSPALEKLRRELQAAREATGRIRGELAVRVADELVAASTGPFVVAALEDAEMLKAVASRITTSPDRVAVLAGRSDDGWRVTVSRNPASGFDCGAFVKLAAARAGGRGGGRPEHAEGKVPASVDWPALAAELLPR
jgi:alanyl-tRNA synthetase